MGFMSHKVYMATFLSTGGERPQVPIGKGQNNGKSLRVNSLDSANFI